MRVVYIADDETQFDDEFERHRLAIPLALADG